MSEERVPVLIGVGQRTVRDEPLDALSTPVDLIDGAARDAAADAGLSSAALAHVDTLAVIKSFREPTRNTPEAVATRIGAPGARQWLVPDGGSGPTCDQTFRARNLRSSLFTPGRGKIWMYVGCTPTPR